MLEIGCGVVRAFLKKKRPEPATLGEGVCLWFLPSEYEQVDEGGKIEL